MASGLNPRRPDCSGQLLETALGQAAPESIARSDSRKRIRGMRVLSGVLADQIGRFDCATDEERVILLLDMLGRHVKVKLPLKDVSPV